MYYSLDANVLISCWNDFYRPQVFKKFWEAMDEAIAQDKIKMTKLAYEECMQKDGNGLKKWLHERKQICEPPSEELLLCVRDQVLKYCPMLVKEGKNKSGADPFVIGLAIIKKGTVVSQENGGSANNPKIPTVCTSLAVRQLDIFDFIAEMGWEF